MATSLETFRKVCGLLGSDSMGERAAAALKATAILREWGKTWADVTVALQTAAPRPEIRPSGPNPWSQPEPGQPFTYRDGRPQEDPAEAYRKAEAFKEEILRKRAARMQAEMEARFAAQHKAEAERANSFRQMPQPRLDMEELELRIQVGFYLSAAKRGDVRIGSFAIKMLEEALAETHWIPVLREAVFDTLTKLWIKSARAAA